MNLRSLSISLQSISDKSRRASVPDFSSDRYRNMSIDSTKQIISTPDIISTTSYQQMRDRSSNELSVGEQNTVTFKEPQVSSGQENSALDVSDLYPV